MRAIIICLSLVVLGSCSKNNVQEQGLIFGNWELRESAGGVAGTIKYGPGNGNRIVFDRDNQYKFVVPPYVNSIPNSGNYTIKQTAGADEWLLTLRNTARGLSDVENYAVRFNGNTLIILAGTTCCDIPTISYVKLTDQLL